MELEEYIKDATEEAMSDYIKSEKYKEHKKQINDLLRSMRENLSSEKMILLNQLLDAISVCDGAFASEAYLQGVVEGIALCKKKIRSV